MDLIVFNQKINPGVYRHTKGPAIGIITTNYCIFHNSAGLKNAHIREGAVDYQGTDKAAGEVNPVITLLARKIVDYNMLALDAQRRQ